MLAILSLSVFNKKLWAKVWGYYSLKLRKV